MCKIVCVIGTAVAVINIGVGLVAVIVIGLGVIVISINKHIKKILLSFQKGV